MPGVLENSKGHMTLTRLWTQATWKDHRSQWRWVRFIKGWSKSSILRAMQVPMTGLICFAVAVCICNRIIEFVLDEDFPRLTLPQTPLGLQASSIGLILVFRTNQTHDRLEEGQKVMGQLGFVAQEIVQMLLIHVKPERRREMGIAIRYISLFGWALKAQLRDDLLSFRPVAEKMLTERDVAWIFSEENPTSAILFRLRSITGELYRKDALDKEVFKFIEEDIAKLGEICSTCNRLTTFPIPPSYHRHGSRAIILWICALPFALEGKRHNFVEIIATVFITGFVILGLDAIAIEIEQPFDVLPLHEFARGMSMDCIAAVDQFCSMPGCALVDPRRSLVLGEQSSTSKDSSSSAAAHRGTHAHEVTYHSLE
eukprot:gnl/MRDRNA2_/MRDRNA2_157209_c0_seq1.p1 gnl/MRDRNA2_/MRDRNA2_157209_c0~~gnl/MRDRNA2_/MRDRNA2_157209_c0_seq1.p1  ORF type:complete len:434 (-),score=64.32 gnl/MRDRNA2_/MRDRNA2_157209_c0_seq1:202-1311(-)